MKHVKTDGQEHVFHVVSKVEVTNFFIIGRVQDFNFWI